MDNDTKETKTAETRKGTGSNELSDDQLDKVAGGFGFVGSIVSTMNTFRNQMPKTIEAIAKQTEK